MDAEIIAKFAALEAQIASLQAEVKKLELDTIDYIEKHGEHHSHVDRMTREAYFKTHPGYIESMGQYYKIVDGKSDKPDEAKS